MKNLYIYTNPDKCFTGENINIVKLQIDNSIELGWDRKDILLYTNFEYEYNGVKSIIVDEIDIDWDRTSNKIFVIKDLMHKGLLVEGELYWYHDFDAYQNDIITAEELGLNNTTPIGLTGYGYKPQINGGGFFFINNDSSRDVFDQWCKQTLEIVRTRADEKTMTDMTMRPIKWGDKTIKPNNTIAWVEGDGSLTGTGYNLLNITYNFGQRCPQLCYNNADKPLKVLHFHPHYEFYTYKGHKNIDIMRGKNKYNVPMMSERLSKLFAKYGY